jgi:hypothetical protein
MTPTEDAVTPFPNPETTPPETTTYFISLSLSLSLSLFGGSGELKV